MPYQAKCAHCGGIFEAVRSDASYCSPSHRALAAQARQREQWRQSIAEAHRHIARLTQLLEGSSDVRHD